MVLIFQSHLSLKHVHIMYTLGYDDIDTLFIVMFMSYYYYTLVLGGPSTNFMGCVQGDCCNVITSVTVKPFLTDHPGYLETS